MNRKRSFLLCCLVFLLPAAGRGQSAESQEEVNVALLNESLDSSTEVLKGLNDQLQELRQRASLQEGQAAQETEVLIERLEAEFDELLAGKQAVAYYNQDVENNSLQQEIVEVFKPLISELKSATADSRQKEVLRSEVEYLNQQQSALSEAVRRVLRQRELAKESDEALYKTLSEQYEVWSRRLDQTNLRVNSAKLQLREKEESTKTSVESASQFIRKFFETRGLHLSIALVAALAVYFSVTLGYRLLARQGFSRRKRAEEGRSTTLQTLDGIVHLGSLVLALVSIIVTFFLCDDWVLLSATLLLLLGFIWSVKDKIPEFSEEIRLILNVGSVREGERVIFDGLPWKVQKIRIYSQLLNPSLEGGVLRVPLNRLVGLHSRLNGKFEKFFPTEINDWVRLADGTFGKVVLQSPDYVELIQLGGSRKTYATSEFLGQNPENLSGHHFRIRSRFGIDYQHQASVTTECLEQLEDFVKKGVTDFVEDPKTFFRLKVEFASAGASSLDFDIFADFTGEMAPKYNVLERLLQKLAVEACNEYNWGIPFTQITVHQASES